MIADYDTPASGEPTTATADTSSEAVVAVPDGSADLTLPQEALPEPVILVVDANRVTRRFIDLALAGPGVRIELAGGLAEALETLGETTVDLVVSAGHLPDGSGLDLLRRMTQRSRARVPFIVVSADQRVATKVAAFAAGVDDYLTKPCEPAELAARAHALIRRARETRSAPAQAPSLCGDLESLPLADLITMLELGQRSAVVNIAASRASAMIYVETGRIVHVVYGALTGIDAFVRLMFDGRGAFEVVAGDTHLPADAHTIAMSTTGLILEAARRLDEERRGSRVGAYWPGRTAARVATNRVPAPAPSPALADQAIHCFLERWSPGELQLLTAAELRDFTRRTASERMHIHLVTSPATGVPALMSQGAPPAEREILKALDGTPLVLTLTMHQNTRSLDVVLIDIARPSELVDHLQRVPSLLVIAPPGGALAQISPRGLVQIDLLIDAVTPTAILGVGNDSLEDYFRAFASLRKGDALTSCVPGPLGTSASALRNAMIRGLRMWATAGT